VGVAGGVMENIQFREDLSAPGLWLAVKDYFCKQVSDPRSGNGNTEIPIPSALMSACAMFALKFPSLLQFDQQKVDPTIAHNLKKLFFVKQAPSDTHMREIIDKINPEEVAGALDLVFSKVQRGKVLEDYTYLDRGYLLSLDGTGYFESQSTLCESCCEKEKKDGSLSYYHCFLPAVIVHPDQRQVIPLGAEAILKQDGATKNDSELKASQRLLKKIRNNHPKLKLTVLADSLHSNGPMIKSIRELSMDFIITAKESNHLSLFQQIRMYDRNNELDYVKFEEEKFHHQFRFKNNVWLNGSSDQKVNFLEYWEHSFTGKTQHWAWVTSIEITKTNIMEIMRGGRARWKVENETFNTLKNQGYQFEHNFGHGYKHLSTNFALLMLLAFAVDQLQEHCCKVFQMAKKVWHSRVALWEKMRAAFALLMFDTWEDFFHKLIFKKQMLYSRHAIHDTS
jgi:hypothetical protein